MLSESMRAVDDEPAPALSVVVTLYNEVSSLEELHRRAVAALEGLGRAFEILYVDDGSTDGTFAVLAGLHAADPRVRAVRFKRNFGQHPAMHAGMSRARGAVIVTMDGDLQNLPEDIPRLVAAVDAGFDVASGRRAARNDSWGRTLPSRLVGRRGGNPTRCSGGTGAIDILWERSGPGRAAPVRRDRIGESDRRRRTDSRSATHRRRRRSRS